MSLATQAVLAAVARHGYPCNDCHTASANASQAAATRLKGQVVRFTTTTAGANSAILPPVMTDSTASEVTVLNEGASTLNVYPAVGEAMNGTANAVLAVASGKVGVFYRVGPNFLPGTSGGWAGGVIG